MRILRISALLAFGLLSAPAYSQPYNQVIVFGDSNVDSGFFKALSTPTPNATWTSLWPTAVAHGAGAPTTNPAPVNSQVLAQFYGLTANPSNTAGGTNYATSAAKNVTVNSAQTGGFSAAVPTVTQIANYLSANGNAANPQALYYIYSGDNDVSYADQDTGQAPWPADPSAYVTQAANDLVAAIVSLKNAGARRFLVAGLAYDFPLGAGNASKRALKLLYTNTLWNGLTSAGVDFYRGDSNLLRKIINNNAAAFGFVYIDTAAGHMACSQPSGIPTAWSLLCSSDPAAPSTYVTPDADETRVFADDAHLAAKAQRILGNYMHNVVSRLTATHDFTSDGRSDILWRHSGGDLFLWGMDGPAATEQTSGGSVSPDWTIVALRNFNGDNTADLLWRNASGATVMWFMNRTTQTGFADLGVIHPSWQVVSTADFDQDGKGDILWRHSSGQLVLWIMNGGVAQRFVDLGTVPTEWSVAATGDFNGDGKADILWRNAAGDLVLWQMRSGAVTALTALGNVPPSWSIIATGDFDGNGNTDLLWREPGGLTAIWLMNNASLSQVAVVGSVPTSWSVAVTGDFDRDHKSDVLWRHSGGQVAMWRMNGAASPTVDLLGAVDPAWTIQGANAN